MTLKEEMTEAMDKAVVDLGFRDKNEFYAQMILGTVVTLRMWSAVRKGDTARTVAWAVTWLNLHMEARDRKARKPISSVESLFHSRKN